MNAARKQTTVGQYAFMALMLIGAATGGGLANVTVFISVLFLGLGTFVLAVAYFADVKEIKDGLEKNRTNEKGIIHKIALAVYTLIIAYHGMLFWGFVIAALWLASYILFAALKADAEIDQQGFKA